MKPESGACCQIFFLIFTVAVAYQEAEDGAPGWGWPSIGASVKRGIAWWGFDRSGMTWCPNKSMVFLKMIMILLWNDYHNSTIHGYYMDITVEL
jgi:hypothetical protein